jgi:hypothetical protein
VTAGDVKTPSGTPIPAGKYLTDDQGALTYSVANGKITPVDYTGFRAPLFGVVQTSKTEKAPDGHTYKLAFIQNESLATPDGTVIERGKYFVDDHGALMFFVHPGVVGTYPYKLKPHTGTFPDVAVGLDHGLYQGGKPVGHDEGPQTAPDEKSYRGVALDAQVGKAAPGHYLIDGDGNAVYRKDDAGTWAPATGLALPGNLAAGKDGTLRLAESRSLGTDEGTDLGIDRKPYRAENLTTVVGPLRPGRYLVNDTNQIAFYSDIVHKYDAPKAQLFRLIIDGTLGGKLPWGLVFIGVFIAIILELLGVASLPFAVGLYLPISTSAAIFVGGAIRWLVDRKRKGESAAEAEFSPGMLMASGLIAGGAILGVIQAILFTADDKGWLSMDSLNLSRFLPNALAINDGMWPMAMFLVMAASLYWIGTRPQKK